MCDQEINNENLVKSLFTRRAFTGSLVSAVIAGTFSPFMSTLAYSVPTSAEKQAEADEVKAKLENWAEQLDIASTNYHLALEAHHTAIEAMEQAQEKLKAAESEMTRLQDKLGARAKAMYKKGNYSFLEVLFGARSFTEFTTTWDLLNSINGEDAALILQNKETKSDAQAAREIFTAQEKLAQEKLTEAEEIKAHAEQLVADYEAELASLEAEVAELIQKEREEEERRQREAATAAMYANNSGPGWGDGVPRQSAGVTDIICQAAIEKLGCPYVWAGNGPDVFDCSGLTKWCYAKAGITIGRHDTAQRAGADSVLPVSAAMPGDVLWRYGHVGIYMGDGAYIHAPTTGDVVRWAWNMGSWTNACRY